MEMKIEIVFRNILEMKLTVMVLTTLLDRGAREQEVWRHVGINKYICSLTLVASERESVAVFPGSP